MSEDPVVIVAAKRTAIGTFGGGLSTVEAPRLGQAVVEAILNDAGVAASDVDEVIMGQVLAAGSGQNPARQTST